MKSILLILITFTSLGSIAATDDKTPTKEVQLFNEILKSLEQPLTTNEINTEAGELLIYSESGKLLYRFSMQNVDPKALRNTDLLLEEGDTKIFIKYRN